MADLLARAIVESAPEIRFDLYHHFEGCYNDHPSRGTHIRAANVSEPFRRLRPFQAKRTWRAVTAGRRQLPGNPDLVHSNCFRAPFVGNAKLIYTLYDLSFWTHPDFTTEVNRLICQEGALQAIDRAAGFLFISQSSRDEFERLLPGLLDEKGIKTKVALLASRFSPLPDSRQTMPEGDWFAVGSVEPRKNYETLLDAFQLYWEKSAEKRRLTIVGGKGWKSKAFHERLRRMEASHQVQYRGYVQDAELLDLYRKSFCLLFPTHYEGFGLPIAEAMSQACPVIARNHSSLPEGGGTAAIYCEDLASQIAEAMVRLESNSKSYLEISAASLLQSRRLSWSSAAEKVVEFYRELLA
jgi:glycosyltransferase involved in cell wall biosynthesis